MKITKISICNAKTPNERYFACLETGEAIEISRYLYDEMSKNKEKTGDFGCEYDELREIIYQYNDQKAKTDAGKPRLTLVPLEILYDVARVREYAVNNKYREPDNWKQVSVERYRDAAFRHLCAYLRDPDGVDEESGLPHLWHLATNIAFLCELEKKDE